MWISRHFLLAMASWLHAFFEQRRLFFLRGLHMLTIQFQIIQNLSERGIRIVQMEQRTSRPREDALTAGGHLCGGPQASSRAGPLWDGHGTGAGASRMRFGDIASSNPSLLDNK